ncbi:Uncharacterised protein [Mycobacteroides abscessus subsp. abscessus]|nr:Uncharacterised protein [Mycobacteroides abscessus subsp. abscessus]
MSRRAPETVDWALQTVDWALQTVDRAPPQPPDRSLGLDLPLRMCKSPCRSTQIHIRTWTMPIVAGAQLIS